MPVVELDINVGVLIEQTVSAPWWSVADHLPIVSLELMVTRCLAIDRDR